MPSPAIKNPAVADLIAKRLPEGLPHPGNAQEHQQPSVIRLPGFNTTGMSPEQAKEFIGDMAQQFGEAITYLIETESGYQIVSSSQLAESIADLMETDGAITTREQLSAAIIKLIEGKA